MYLKNRSPWLSFTSDFLNFLWFISFKQTYPFIVGGSLLIKLFYIQFRWLSSWAHFWAIPHILLIIYLCIFYAVRGCYLVYCTIIVIFFICLPIFLWLTAEHFLKPRSCNTRWWTACIFRIRRYWQVMVSNRRSIPLH